MFSNSLVRVIRFMLKRDYLIETYFDKAVVMDEKKRPVITLTKSQIEYLEREVPLSKQPKENGFVYFLC